MVCSDLVYHIDVIRMKHGCTQDSKILLSSADAYNDQNNLLPKKKPHDHQTRKVRRRSATLHMVSLELAER
jgi:hypothetical protein